ncbi:hypothetical protein ACS0TY_016648 [Phlomoides rotata]
MAHDIIATEGNLFTHHVPLLPACSWCGASFADTKHCIFMCPTVRHFWKAEGLWKSCTGTAALSTTDFLQHLASLRDGPTLAVIAAISWSIWRQKCDLLHSTGSLSMKVQKLRRATSVGAKMLIQNFVKAREVYNSASHSTRIFLLFGQMPVQQGSLAAEDLPSVWTDARFNEERREFDVGCMIKGTFGTILAAGGSCIAPPGTVLGAELQGILEGIRLLKNMGGDRAILRTDSINAVHAIKTKECIWNSAGAVRDIILKELEDFLVWDIVFTPRHKNRAPHEIAKFLCFSSSPQAWHGDDLPFWLKEVAHL